MQKTLLAVALTAMASIAQAGQLNEVTVAKAGVIKATATQFYLVSEPVGEASVCTSSQVRLPTVAADPGRAVLSMLLSAQATQSKVNITFTGPASGICTLTDIELLANP